MLRKTDIRLGQYLIRRQWCTLRQITDALDRQKKLSSTDQHQCLGTLLVTQGALNAERLNRALADLGALTLLCGACQIVYEIRQFDEDHEYLCSECQGPLHLSSTPPKAQEARLYVATPRAVSQSRTDAEGGAAKDPDGRTDVSPGRDPLVGKVLGGCQLLERIAVGGMGVVYKARQLNLGRTVAVKVLSEEFSRDATFVRRFIEEARAAGQLSHGNIIHINDVGEYQGTFYFTMEFVAGQSLKDLLNREERLEIGRALDITLQVCAALDHAHSRGIVHRDIKPENIMLTADGAVKLADLGLAKHVTPSGDGNLTQAGSILGTPFYMAPEQAKNFSSADQRSDIYSLGVTLFKMISGVVPFSGRSPIEIMIKVVEGRGPALREVSEGVPPEVERIVDRMMRKEPEKRYQSVSELVTDIGRVRRRLSVPAEPG